MLALTPALSPRERENRRQPVGEFYAVWHGALLFAGCALLALRASAADFDNILALPEVGATQLRALSPTVLELTLITTKAPNATKVGQWDFADFSGHLHLPSASKMQVTAGGKTVPIHAVGFRRRVVYAPLATRDLRIGNYLYLELATPLPDGQSIEVTRPQEIGLYARMFSYLQAEAVYGQAARGLITSSLHDLSQLIATS
jgi:hypothetical protein